ncbi:hypothetical protein, partial [Mycolicibacter kumamotonensis]|uniref:hypothetical protein n=1 Tax=Mycolicibacter kumamotonensis TaxID=354243 RepID=UPI001969F667
ISRSDAVTGATPLAHSPATVIKLHGDWKDLEFRNTLDELTTYPQPWIDLPSQVFSEYGLLVSGWSAEWDKALLRVLEASPRRYPLYWDGRSSKHGTARNLLTQQGGQVIEAASADELFVDLSASLDALTRLAEPPLTTAMAVSRLKRALPDPIRRIELRDLILDYTADLAKTLVGTASKSREWADMDTHLDNLLEATKPLLTLLVTGIRYDDGTHTDLWVEALQRVLERSSPRPDAMIHIVDELRNYPALLVLRAMCVQAAREGDDRVVIALLTRPRWENPLNSGRSPIAADVLHTLNIIEDNFANGLPRWEGTRWVYPRSHLMKMVLKDFFDDQGLDYSAYRVLVHDVEYRTGFVQYLLPHSCKFRRNPDSGEFIHCDEWTSLDNTGENEAPRAEVRFRAAIARDDGAGWAGLLGGRDMENELVGYREILKRYRGL